MQQSSIHSDDTAVIPPAGLNADATCQTDVSELAALAARKSAAAAANKRTDELPQLGSRYQITGKLGQGGMGAVYRGIDTTTGSPVAIKVLPQEFSGDESVVQRFQKETRLLSEVRHPNVANMLDSGVFENMPFLVMELVEGMDLKAVVQSAGALPEPIALQIIADIASALQLAHERGIIHRDIKPANILLSVDTDDEPTRAAVLNAIGAGQVPRARLTDFGLARHIDQAASLELTRTGMMLGTPYYISPEQCAGKAAITPSADIYSLGVTLFELLTGRPPFQTDDPVKLIAAHCFETAPDIRKRNPEISDGAAELVAKTLQKTPESRHVDAAHFLNDLNRLLRGDVTTSMHPTAPSTNGHVFEATWEWVLNGNAADLWPYLSNTDRVNSALGLPSVEYVTRRDSHGTKRRFGSFKLGWTRLSWEEHPYEWIEGQQFSILREFENGPFQWFISSVKLTARPEGGTHLQHSVRIATRGMMGRLIAFVEVNLKSRKQLDRVYRRIDDVVTGRLKGGTVIDPFTTSTSSASERRKIDALRNDLLATTGHPECLDGLLELLAESPAQELARLRPRAMARRLHVDPELLTQVCLKACHAGLLELHWDVVCPTCRVAATVRDSLNEIDRHEHCEACEKDFDVDFSSSVELIFRVHPDVRKADLKTYCIGGPDHAPHVLAQVQIDPGEVFELDLALEAGSYLLRGTQLPYTVGILAEVGAANGRLRFPIGPDKKSSQPLKVRPGRQIITVQNEYAQPIVVRLERTMPRKDVLTASEALQLPDFRRLFPTETLTRDKLSTMSTCTMLALRVPNVLELFTTLGDAGTADVLKTTLSTSRLLIESHGGQLIKEQDDRLLAVFPQALAALETALQLNDAFGATTDESLPQLQMALHRGTAMSTSFNGRLDYFGRSVTLASAILDAAEHQTLVVSHELINDIECAEALMSRNYYTKPHSQSGGLNLYRIVKNPGEQNSVSAVLPTSERLSNH
jgi:serine/threonine protein kinase/class 3 adenylate cyclase